MMRTISIAGALIFAAPTLASDVSYRDSAPVLSPSARGVSVEQSRTIPGRARGEWRDLAGAVPLTAAARGGGLLEPAPASRTGGSAAKQGGQQDASSASTCDALAISCACSGT